MIGADYDNSAAKKTTKLNSPPALATSLATGPSHTACPSTICLARAHNSGPRTVPPQPVQCLQVARGLTLNELQGGNGNSHIPPKAVVAQTRNRETRRAQTLPPQPAPPAVRLRRRRVGDG